MQPWLCMIAYVLIHNMHKLKLIEIFLKYIVHDSMS
jgi:hypothetical protein